MNNKKEENVQNSTASIPKEPYSPPKFWLACPENDFDFDIRKAYGPNGENPWIHDGCYESAGIRPGKDTTLELYQKIVYTTETGYKGILETNKNGDPQVTVGLPNGESSSWIDYGYQTGEELAKLIESAEERGQEAWLVMDEPSLLGIERVMVQKGISREKAAEYVQRKNKEMANEQWEQLKMMLDQKTNKKEA